MNSYKYSDPNRMKQKYFSLNNSTIEVTFTIRHTFKLGCLTFFITVIITIIFFIVLAMPSSLKEENINFTTVEL